MPPKKRLSYDESFVKFGFIVISAGGEEKPQCVLCHKVFACSSRKPCKLKRHLETHHPNSKDKGADFFKRHGQNSRFDSMGKFFKENTAALKASYEVSREIAIAKKPHNIGEQLILPCCKIIMSNLMSESEVEKLNQVSLSNNTVSRRIAELSNNILSQVVTKIQNSKFNFFAIQLDETTDVANLAQLCIYARYIHEEHLEDEFLFCKILDTKTTAKHIFRKVDEFFGEHNIQWKNLVGVCTDGAPAMLRCRSGFQTLVKEKSPDVVGIHCTIHRQALMVKTMPYE
uniref:zinc finger BED domain-containing protein 5-like n=1 Tax=Styela clava TaxID=7725 RepID=UPI001939E4A8|nr:zinc finger BED domain-containing protein 5-like [Styela clava]